jgi:Tfp pilus assembly protein FimT
LAHKSGGFTLLEAMIVIFLIATVSTIAAPNLIAWRNKAKLRAAADNLKGDLELAKLKAVMINGSVAMNYSAGSYQIFDDSIGAAYVRESGEKLYIARTLPAGVKIDTDKSGDISFTGRGTADSGTIHLIDSKGVKKQVIVSAVGRIRIDSDQEK